MNAVLPFWCLALLMGMQAITMVAAIALFWMHNDRDPDGRYSWKSEALREAMNAETAALVDLRKTTAALIEQSKIQTEEQRITRRQCELLTHAIETLAKRK